MANDNSFSAARGTSPAPEEAALLSELVSFPTGNAADAILQAGLPFGVVRGVRPFGTGRPFAGPAFPVHQVRRRAGAPPDVNLTRHPDAVDEYAAPGQVLVIAAGGNTDAATLGALLAFRAHKRGVAGIVIEGDVRDVPEFPEVGIPVYASASCPVGSAFVLETVAMGEPVEIGGTTVTIEDIIFGDPTGILVFPRRILPQVVEGARAIAAREKRWEAVLSSGQSFAEAKRRDCAHATGMQSADPAA